MSSLFKSSFLPPSQAKRVTTIWGTTVCSLSLICFQKSWVFFWFIWNPKIEGLSSVTIKSSILLVPLFVSYTLTHGFWRDRYGLIGWCGAPTLLDCNLACLVGFAFRFIATSVELEPFCGSCSYSSDVLLMAAPRNLIGDTGKLLRDEETAEEDDSPSGKKPKLERIPLNRWEFAAALGVLFVFSAGLCCIYLTMPAAEYEKFNLPRTISDLRMLKYVLHFICSHSNGFIFNVGFTGSLLTLLRHGPFVAFVYEFSCVNVNKN